MKVRKLNVSEQIHGRFSSKTQRDIQLFEKCSASVTLENSSPTPKNLLMDCSAGHSVHCTHYAHFLRAIIIFFFSVSPASPEYLLIRFLNLCKKSTNNRVSDYQEHFGLCDGRKNVKYGLHFSYSVVIL